MKKIIVLLYFAIISVVSAQTERHFQFQIYNNGPGYAYVYYRIYYGPSQTFAQVAGEDVQAGQTKTFDYPRYSDGDWPVLVQCRAAGSAVGFDSATNIGNFTVSLDWVSSHPYGIYTNIPIISTVTARWRVRNDSGVSCTYSYNAQPEGQTTQEFFNIGSEKILTVGPRSSIFDINQFVYFKTADGWNRIMPGGKVPDSCWTGGEPLIIIGGEGIDVIDGQSPTNTPAITGDTNTVDFPTNSIPSRTNAAGPWAMEVTLEDVGRIVHLDMLSIQKINQLGFGTANGYLLQMSLNSETIARGVTNIAGIATGIKSNTENIQNSTTQILSQAIRIGDSLEDATNLLGSQLILETVITNEIGEVIRSQAIMTNQVKSVTNMLQGISNGIVTMVTNLALVTNILTKIDTNTHDIVKNGQDTTNLLSNITNQLDKISKGQTNQNTNGSSPYGVDETLSILGQLKNQGMGASTGAMYSVSSQMSDLGGTPSHSYNQQFFKISIFNQEYNIDPFANGQLASLIYWFRFAFYWVFCFGMFFMSYKVVQMFITRSFAISSGPSGATSNPISFGVAVGGIALTVAAYGVFIAAAYGLLGPNWVQTLIASPFEASGAAAQGIGLLFAIFPIQDMFNCVISFISLSTIALVAYVALGYQQKVTVS